MPIRPENRERYPANWRAISLAIRRDRAHWRCECPGVCGTDHVEGRCLAVQYQPHPITGSRVILTTAHLDHQPENCDPANLLALCQRCHLRYDRHHHAQTAARTRALAAQATGQLALLETTP